LPENLTHHGADGLITAQEAEGTPISIDLLGETDLEGAFQAVGESLRALAGVHEFKAQEGRVLVVTDSQGRLARVLFGLGKAGPMQPMLLRGLPGKLPPADYVIANAPEAAEPGLLALAWAMGRYGFDRYRNEARKVQHRPRLVAGEGVDIAAVRRVAHACALARDMINTPANDMGPLQIETIVREVAHSDGAEVSSIVGDDLLEAGYPAVHAVGRAAAPPRAPRMIELNWSNGGEDAPRLVLIGKGVVFDTGGLDIKPSAGMRLMKKDMGGAAHALALARMVMGAELKVRLTLLLPVVENAISGDAMRPGDVIGSRKGLSIEVGNTDAEGRLILADALARAGELGPDLTIDLATLTGAARVAVGPELAPFFTDDDALATALERAAKAESDPVWRLPLWAPYGEALSSDVADLANDPAGWAQAGSVTAALFLQRFAPESGAWMHLDVFGWNGRGRPGWPVGGEAQAIRALFRVIGERYGA
jgi:leucyl aminopeptidase